MIEFLNSRASRALACMFRKNEIGSAPLHIMPIHTKKVSTSFIEYFNENTRGKKKLREKSRKKKNNNNNSKKQSKNNMFPNFIWGT